MPTNYLEDGSIKSVGVVIAHGINAELQRGPLLSSLATHLAKQGYVVMRYFCKQKEQRRQRIFERSVDTVVASPYASGVKKWVFIGHENGARIVTSVGYKTHRPKHGFIFLSYPLMEPAPPPPKQKAGAEPPADSIGPLMKLIEIVKAPQLFICGEMDYNCPGADLKAIGPQLQAAGVDARAVIFENLDAHFRNPENEGEAALETFEKMFGLIDTFLRGIEADSVASLHLPEGLPSFDSIIPSTRVPPRPENGAAAEVEEEMEMDGAEGAPHGTTMNTTSAAANNVGMNPATMLATAQHAALQQQRLTGLTPAAAAQQAQQIQALQMAMFQQQIQASVLHQQQQQPAP